VPTVCDCSQAIPASADRLTVFHSWFAVSFSEKSGTATHDLATTFFRQAGFNRTGLCFQLVTQAGLLLTLLNNSCRFNLIALI